MTAHALTNPSHGPHATATLRIALVVTVAVVLVAQLPAYQAVQSSTEPTVSVRTANARSLAANLKLVNYYPRDRAWEQQWTRYSAEVMSADFEQIRGLGATSVRIIVFPKVLGFPQPSTTEQRHLSDTIRLADAAGLRVWLTLFDNFTSYANLEGSRTWTTALLTPYVGDNRISAIEVRNEIKIASIGAAAWAQDQIALLHQLVPDIPVTISQNGSIDPAMYGTMLDALSPQVPDLISYHYYGDAGLAYDHIRQVLAAVSPVPVVVGEAGLSTAAADNRCPDQACREAEQLDWFQIVVAAARQAGLATPAPWTMYDLTPDATDRTVVPAGYGYGLYRVNGTAKPAAAVFRNSFVDDWTLAPQNTDFTETSMDGARARAWVPSRITGTFRVDPTGGMAGAPALAITGTDTLPDGSSAWFARPLTAVQPGQIWWAHVYARGVGATGHNTMALVWLDPDGAYLRQSVARTELNPANPDWQELWVAVNPPAGAVAVRLHLRSSGNAGTVYFSKPDWIVYPG